MASPDDYETTDVLICGCGPTGAMLSAYLGQMSIKNVVLEKEDEIATDPRGIALDEDGIRLLQGLGIYDGIYSEIGTCKKPWKNITPYSLHQSFEPRVRC
jgi:2-polyprenyl-6-methoxyphenol hydroxylase-like FAD-dependent oxidoreductase